MIRKLLLLTPLLTAATCGVSPAKWYETGKVEQPYDKVWQSCLDVIEKHGFVVKRADKDSRIIETEWKVQLYPRWREGRREQIEMEITQIEEGKYNIRTRCQLELNDNAKNPMVLNDAEWIAGGGADEVALRMKTLLRMKLRGIRLDD